MGMGVDGLSGGSDGDGGGPGTRAAEQRERTLNSQTAGQPDSRTAGQPMWPDSRCGRCGRCGRRAMSLLVLGLVLGVVELHPGERARAP